jgi:tetratricopeptide (TPR) repeat protein
MHSLSFRVLAAALALASLSWQGCSRDPDRLATRYLATGRQYLERRDYARAVIQFRNAVRSAPSNAEAHYQLGAAALHTGDFLVARASLEEAARLDPRHKSAQLLLARLMQTSRNPDVWREAERRLQSVLDFAPDDAEALNLLGLTELRLGRAGDAEEHLRLALDRMPQSLSASVALARVQLSRGDLPGAETTLKKAVADAPKSVDPLLALGEFYSASRRLAQAEEQFRKALALDANSGWALEGLAGLQAASGKPEDAEATYRRMAALPDPRYRASHAWYLLRTRRVEAGTAELERLVKADPSDRQTRTLLAAVYRAAGRSPDAESLLSNALRGNARDVGALVQRAAVRLEAGRLTEAQSDLHAALRFEPTSGPAHLGMARVYQARGEALLARQEFNEALIARPDLLPARLELARLLVAARSEKAALDLLDAAPDRQKDSPALTAVRNWALIALRDWAAARKGIQQALAVNPSPEILVQDAQVRFAARDFAGARTSLDRALAADPGNLAALGGLVSVYTAQGDGAGALERLRREAAKAPGSARVQHFLGTALLRFGKRDDARRAFASAKAADPNFVSSDLALAQMDLADGKLEAARRALAGVLSRAGRSASVRVLLGVLEEKAGNRQSAVGHYREALRVDRDNLVALNNLAYLLADSKADEALSLAQRAKEIAPADNRVEDTIGWAYYHKGLFQMARSHLESAARAGNVPPEDAARCKLHLAMVYHQLGDANRSREFLAAGLKLGPELPEAGSARALILGAPGAPAGSVKAAAR